MIIKKNYKIMGCKIMLKSNCNQENLFNLDTLISQFITEKKCRNLSEHSIIYYKDTLDKFSNWFYENKYEILDKNVINDYIAYLFSQNLKETSINSNLRAIRTFVNYLINENILEKPFKVKLIKEREYIKETYSEEDLKRLLKVPNKKDRFPIWRCWAIINFVLATGSRLGTIINIRLGDLDFDNDIVTLKHTKNKKPQIIPMSDNLKKVLHKYISTWFEAENDDFLFPAIKGSKATEECIKHSIYKYNKSKGVENTSIHAFRHTFAKMWILNGGDVFRLQKILGHSSIDMTQRYVNIYGNDLKRDFDKFNPLDNISSNNYIKRK